MMQAKMTSPWESFRVYLMAALKRHVLNIRTSFSRLDLGPDGQLKELKKGCEEEPYFRL
jgi:hypothetical protein